MAKVSKKQKLINTELTLGAVYPVAKAVEILKKYAGSSKFPESIDAAINLGVDPKKSDQAVRSAVVLPHGTGKTARVAVFAQGTNADAAKAAGADIVGFEDLAESIKAGNMDFDVVIASPDAMRIVGQLGQVLGPRGLMPNPKVGTVTADVAGAVKNAKSGQVRYRADKNGIIHCSIGKVGFAADQIEQNLQAVLQDLKKVRPASAKGVYLKKITLSSTMGPGLIIDQSSIAAG
jgi:large subunit ribosomal protein L1